MFLCYSLLETELHVTERVHGTPFQELSLSGDFKSKTERSTKFGPYQESTAP